MAAHVAVKVPATQPGDPLVHDGKNKIDSPLPASDLIKRDDSDLTMTSMKCPTSKGTGQGRGRGTDGSPVHSGRTDYSPREDTDKVGSSTQESMANGDSTRHQAASAGDSDTSCNCPDGPGTRPLPSGKHPKPSPRKPQTKVPPPKLPPKPPHLLQYRSPSSENLTGRGNTDRDKDKQTAGRDRRSQSVSVVSANTSPQKDDVFVPKPFKRPVPAPRKSLPNTLNDASNPAINMKNSNQLSSPDSEAHSPNSEAASPVSGTPGSKWPSRLQGDLGSPDSESGQLHGSPVYGSREDLSHNANKSGVPKSPRKPSTKSRHVRVRERAAIFEKLIEVETSRNRESQISEPRSRTSSRASDISEAAFPRFPEDHASYVRRSPSRQSSYINVQLQHHLNLPENIRDKKDGTADDETTSMMSMSPDDVFSSSHQSSHRSHPHRPPSPNLSEDEGTELNISNKNSSYTNVIIPDSQVSSLNKEESKMPHIKSDYNDVIVPDSGEADSGYTDVVMIPESSATNQDSREFKDSLPEPVSIQVIPKTSTPESEHSVQLSTTQDSADTDVVISESSYTPEDTKMTEIPCGEDSDYTDVTVPDTSASQDSVSTKVPLADEAKPASRRSEPRFSISLDDSPAREKSDLLSPDRSSLKPFHGTHAYRNVTPLFAAPPRLAKSRDEDSSSHCDSADREPSCQLPGDDVTKGEAHHAQEGREMKTTDSAVRKSCITEPSETQSEIESDLQDHQQTAPIPVSEEAEHTTESSDMAPEPRRGEQPRRKSHPPTAAVTLYEVCLPGLTASSSPAKGNTTPDTAKESPDISEAQKNPEDSAESGTIQESPGVTDDQHLYMNEEHTYESQITDTVEENGSSGMLCNRSRRQRFAVKKRDSKAFTSGRKKWQHESAPATLGGLERQEAVAESPENEISPCPSDGSNRLSQVSSVGSTISSLISNVSIEDNDQLSSDDEDYEDVQPPSSGADGIPLLPPKSDEDVQQLSFRNGDGSNTAPQPDASDARSQEEEASLQQFEEDKTYSTLYDCQPMSVDTVHQDAELSQDIKEVDNEGHTKQHHAPIEIEMQPMRTKSPRSPEKECRRKAFEFHMPLFLKNSSSIESSTSVPLADNNSSRHSHATHSEDSDMSSDYIDEVASIPGVGGDSEHKIASSRESGTSYEQSEDSLSVRSSRAASTDSLNASLQSVLRDRNRQRQRSGEYGRPVSEYDRPVSNASAEYDRPVSCISTEYDRPISSSSADYISVLNSFHKDGKKKDEDSEGFSFTWTVNQVEEDSQQDETYRPKSDEVPAPPPTKYASPRKASDAAQPVPVLPVTNKALRPPKVPRPYSEPSLRKPKRNSLVKSKILPVPSKEEITEQFCKISRQRSRFVSQEPLFQLYQEDARSRDSYLRLMNVSSLESLAAFLEKQEAIKKEKRESDPTQNSSSQQPEYRVLIPDDEIYRYQSKDDSQSGDNKNRHLSGGDDKNRPRSGNPLEEEAIYQSAEPVYEPPGELFYDTGDILHTNTIYESGSLGSSTGEGSGGSGSDVEIPKPYGLMQRTTGTSAVRRSYWSELPEVLQSGLLEQMTSEEKRLQEALFEVVTSEASYLRSLNLVVEHFGEAITLQPPTGLLNKVQHHRLFSNIRSVRDASERLLLDLEERQQDSIIISDVCDILLQHFEKGGFNCYIIYCANNQYQIKTLEELRKNPSFIEAMKLLESSPACCSLDLQSFLMLPFQRITRLPLLIEAIRQQAKLDSPLHTTAIQALSALRNMAEKCNEEAKRMEMIEEVTQLANQLDFREGVKKMNLSQTTSIVKRGRLQIIKKDNKILNRGKLIAKAIYVIVFTDKVAVCKQRIKGEQLKYDVFDWCPRNLVQVEAVSNPQSHGKLPDGVPSTCKHVFLISFLQNNQKKEVEFAVDANSEAERERWMDAMHPAKRTQDGETIYESWDCPQVICKQPYEAQDRDELTLDLYDRMDIDKKIEGWYYGTRVSDHAKGWFPARFTQEVVNDHVLARNLKQRHRLLSLCDQHLRTAKNIRK